MLFMNKYLSKIFFVLFVFFTSSLHGFAQEAKGYERIDSFSSDITVNTDSTIDIVETIKYNSGGTEKHGIYRDIKLKSYNNENLIISNISVKDENNIAYGFVERYPSGKVSLKIGDANVTFSGEKIYVIKYKIIGAMGYFEKYDEIYWNATGNDWAFPIEHSTASIHLPVGVNVLQSASYCGPTGSNLPCINDGQGIFSYDTELAPGAGMTVSVGFPKGIVKQIKSFFAPLFYYVSFLFPLIPLLAFIYMFKKWKIYGKDPKSNRTIIAEYDVPDGLTPLEVIAIVDQKVDGKAISAEIIFLAIKGFLKIEKTEDKFLFIKNDDYLLSKLSYLSTENGADNILMEGLFSLGNEIKISLLKNKFYTYIYKITNSVFDKLVGNGYYKNLPKKVVIKYYLAASIVLFLGTFISIKIIPYFGPSPIISIIVSSIIIFVFGALMPARTEKGLLTKEYLLGFKEYLDIAEKDRINFHNAPEKKPEIFEKFLPYAMVFGVEKAWAKEFEGIYTVAPNWYSDRGMSTFSTVAFANSLNSFATYSNNTMSSTPGGSGGHGSSGGGGGGGGGGSW